MILHNFTNYEFKKVAFYLSKINLKRTRVHLNIKTTYFQLNSKGLTLSEGGPLAFFFDNERPIEMTFPFVNRVPNSIDHIIQN